MNVINMKRDVTLKIREYFIQNNIKFNANTFEDYICEWMDICDKRVIAKKRKVIFSKELQRKIDNNEINDETKQLINVFKLKFENGDNIMPYLSTNIKNATTIDYLLTMWRIHHLHLTNKLKDDMSERSDKYILFTIHDDNVYFLDQTKHLAKSEFASRYLLELLDNNNWLHFVSIFKSPQILSVEYEITSDDELYRIWKSNLNHSVYKIGDSFYTNINGLTFAGTSLQNQLCICDLNKAIFRVSQLEQISYSRSEIDGEKMRLSIYYFYKNEEHEWIRIEGEEQ